MLLPRKKIEFLPETGGFWCILGLLFTFKKAQEKAYETNWSGQWGVAAPPNPPLLKTENFNSQDKTKTSKKTSRKHDNETTSLAGSRLFYTVGP